MTSQSTASTSTETASSIMRPALTIFLVLSLVTGLLYPLAVTGLAQILFPHKANGSLVQVRDHVVGSELIGQNFSASHYFWGRPSATAPMVYNAAASSGSNLGPSNPNLTEAVKARIAALRAADPGNTRSVPIDLVTASASGLDPHISVAAAEFQVDRVARARNISPAQVQTLVVQHTQGPWLGFLGEPRVHVLQLNLALDTQGTH